MKRTARSAHHARGRRLSSTLVAQVSSPSVAVVLLTAPRWKTISSGGPGLQEGVQTIGMNDRVRRVAGEIPPLALASQ